VSIEFSPKLREGRPVLVLIPLLLAHVILLSIQIEDGTGGTLFRRWTLRVGGPILNGAAASVRGVSNVWKGYVWFHGVRQENARLNARLQQLALRDGLLGQMEEENTRLRRMLEFKETLAVETLGARIVARGPSPDFLSSVLVIDRGTADGVQANAPVVCADGVVGRTIVVTARNAQVQVLTNPDSSVGAMVERARSPGVLSGSGDRLLRLNYVSNSEAIEVNDKVFTSGLDGIFPKGLPLGTVVLSQKGTSVFRLVNVLPAVDLLHVEEVLVIVNRMPVRL
jgi:rod shape-determining protein MreC